MNPQDIFLEKGIMGAVIVVLAGAVLLLCRAIYVLYKDNNDLRDKLATKAEEYAESKGELATKVIDTVGTLNELFSKNRGN